MTRRGLLILAGILLVQSLVVVRVFTPRPHSGGDNAGYVALAHSILDRAAYLELWDPAEPPHTKYPPVFPLVLAGVLALGVKGWIGLKVIPAFSVVLAVAFTFLWVQGRRGSALAVGVALLVGFSESVVYYSQWVLSDPTFLALTLGALWVLDRKTEGAGTTRADPASREALDGGVRLGVGMALVTLAYFTRSAGLPLAVAVLGWLALERRWKPLAVFAIALGLPAFLWWLRGSLTGGSGYVSEFWLVDPYQPHLGTVGLGGLVDRVVENLNAYVTRIIPEGVVGEAPSILPPLGLGFLLLAGVGWARALVERARVAEIFLPLYFGLILLWPVAWSGDRFSLPLLPLMFYYSAAALLWMLGAVPNRVRRSVLVVLAVVVLLPAIREWDRMAEPAAACRDATAAGRWQSCLLPPEAEYREVAEWSGTGLPEGAVVTTRKPRIFYLFSGVKARSIPFLRDPDRFLAQLRDDGSRYLTLDRLDGVARYYVYPVVTGKMSRFCLMVSAGTAGRNETLLLGLQESPGEGGSPEGREPSPLGRCPPAMFGTGGMFGAGQDPSGSREPARSREPDDPGESWDAPDAWIIPLLQKNRTVGGQERATGDG